MEPNFSTLLPPVRLAIAYAGADLRGRWGLLLALDNRIAGFVGRPGEPLFAQMKIAWWQEALAKPLDLQPKGEPLFAQLQQLQDAGHAEGLAAAMHGVLDAWGILAANDWGLETLQAFAEARSAAVFGSYVSWAKTDAAVDELGQYWALNDLALRFGDKVARSPDISFGRTFRLPRPLTILALSVRPGVSGIRLIWHALTGK